MKTNQSTVSVPPHSVVPVREIRKYTELVLHRYAKVRSGTDRVQSKFEDAVNFCCDVEMALSHLTDPEQHLVASVALQEYSLGESAAMCKVSLRHAISNYGHALDSLGSEFVQVGILPRTNTFVAC